MNITSLADLPDVLTVDEAAAFLRLGRNSVYEAARSGELPCLRVGRRVLFPKTALARLLDEAVLVPEAIKSTLRG